MLAIQRLLRHALYTRSHMQRRFPVATSKAIEAAIADSETRHRGQIRVAIEAALSPAQVVAHLTPQQRALDVFSQLRVWDTEENTGVLIYLLLADRAIEIIADRGIHAKTGQAPWDAITQSIQDAFAQDHYDQGALAAIAAAGMLLERDFPASGPNPNEQPDNVTML